MVKVSIIVPVYNVEKYLHVLATGETHPIRSFVELSGKYAGFDIEWQGEGVNEVGIDKKTGKTVVKVSPKFFRPVEVELLIDAQSKAENVVGWTKSFLRMTLQNDGGCRC